MGGHCIAVDPWFIVDGAPDDAQLIKTARNVNDSKPDWVIKKIKEAAKQLNSPTIACLGLSFKADIDDLRESPAMVIVERLAELKLGDLIIVEPNINELPLSLKNKAGIRLANINNINNINVQADIVIILVDHKEFRQKERKFWLNTVIIDTKGILKFV